MSYTKGMARRKGRRGEQELVIHLSKLGYKAERILSQVRDKGQPDVLAKKDGKEITFESKLRKDSYKTIYDLYYSNRDGDGVLRFVTHSGGTCVAMSTDFESLLSNDHYFRNMTLFPPSKRERLTYERIVRLNRIRQLADILVIKDNGKPRLYFRFWG